MYKATDSRPASHLDKDKSQDLVFRSAQSDLTGLNSQRLGTGFVGVLSDPGDGDASDLGVAESQQEGAVGFGHQQVLRLLLVDEAQDGPAGRKSRWLKAQRNHRTSGSGLWGTRV